MIHEQSKRYDIRRWTDSIKECFPDLNISRVDRYLRTQKECIFIGRAEHPAGNSDFYHYKRCSVCVGKSIQAGSGIPYSVRLSVFSEDQDMVRLTFNELEAALLEDTTIMHS